MKRLIPILLAVICLSSCLPESTSDYSPDIRLSIPTTTGGDTLGYTFDEKASIFRMDTIHIGDTVQLAVAYMSYTKNLISTHVAWDSTYLQLWSEFDDSYLASILPESDTKKLDLYYPTNSNYNYAALPIYFTPKKTGRSKLEFRVVSDSKFSPTEYSILVDVAK